MTELVFPAPALSELRAGLEHPKHESGAILLATPVEKNGATRLLVREVHIAQDKDYAERSAVSLTLKTDFCLPIEKKAKEESLSLVYCHTHPFAQRAEFSTIDDESEKRLQRYLKTRHADAPHAALLFAAQDLEARRLGTTESVAVVEIGSTIWDSRAVQPEVSHNETFDRQVLAFGPIGQARLAAVHVAIVGLGGTGSAISQQLAHLGVRHFTLVDHDIVEASNINRLIGATASDVGKTAKIDVAERLIRSLRADADVRLVPGDITRPEIAEAALTADVIFSCTDTHASRHVLNQIAYQFYIPIFDMGVAITVAPGKVQFSGHAKMLAPGLPSLWCSNNLDPAQVRQELMTDEQRAADPYVQGGPGVAQPAVISLNGVVSSLAVTMFLAAFAGVPSPPRYVTYDGNRARVNPLEAAHNPDCVFCGDASPRGLGNRSPLPTRQ
jgi:molybdopterin/thiamine biosynthesis adenylyltransferase